jgi:hypothetical protein
MSGPGWVRCGMPGQGVAGVEPSVRHRRVRIAWPGRRGLVVKARGGALGSAGKARLALACYGRHGWPRLVPLGEVRQAGPGYTRPREAERRRRGSPALDVERLVATCQRHGRRGGSWSVQAGGVLARQDTITAGSARVACLGMEGLAGESRCVPFRHGPDGTAGTSRLVLEG